MSDVQSIKSVIELYYVMRDFDSIPSVPISKEEFLARNQLVEYEISTLDPPQRIPGCNVECWEWRHGGPWSELAATKEQALTDQREYVMEMME